MHEDSRAPADITGWVTINRAMKMVGVSRSTIYKWLSDGKLDTARTAGGQVRINPQSLVKKDQS